MLYKVVFGKYVWFEFLVYYLLRLTGLKKKEYLRGEGSTDECAELFKEYKSCLNVGLCSLSLCYQFNRWANGGLGGGI